MIKNMLIIGDSHAGFLSGNNIGIDVVLKDNVYFAVFSAKTIYNFNYDNVDLKFKKIFEMIDNEWVVLPIFGEVDIRVCLCKYNNPEVVVKEYVNKTLKFFQPRGCKIHFIEPVPQSDIFLDDIIFKKTKYFHDGQWPKFGNIKERISMHDKFIELLKKECANNNLESPIAIAKNITKTNQLQINETDDGLHLSNDYANKTMQYIKSLYNI